MADRKLFVNLPIRDLERSKAFFSALGFTFDPQFSGEGGACLVISAEARVMLVTEAIFKTLTERDVCDTRTHVEVLVTVSCESRAEVDRLVNLAAAHGGKARGRAAGPRVHVRLGLLRPRRARQGRGVDEPHRRADVAPLVWL